MNLGAAYMQEKTRQSARHNQNDQNACGDKGEQKGKKYQARQRSVGSIFLRAGGRTGVTHPDCQRTETA